MASRKGKDKKAINDSLTFEEEPKQKHRKQAEAGSDFDTELWQFFSGGYVGDLGLRSTMGSALERAAFELGPSTGGMPSGFNDLVRFGVNGPAGRVEAGRVARALAKLSGDCPDQKLKKEWRYYYPVLKAYYTQHSTSYYEGIMGAFQEHSGVALVVPKGRKYIFEWCTLQCTKDLAANEAAIKQSKKERGERKKPREEQIRWNPDTTSTILTRWSSPSEEDSLAALRALVKACNGAKDVPTQKAAKATLQGILDEARTLRWNARAAYVLERRKVDGEIRDRPKKQDDAEVAKWAASLEYIHPDTD